MINPKSKSPTELEAKIVVCSKRPKQIFTEIAELKKINDCHVTTQETIQLHDVYWDKPNNILQKNQLSLRTRSENSKQFITIKGAAEVTNWGAVKRKETEVRWTQQGLEQIINELENNCIKLPNIPINFTVDSPKTVFESLGFIVIQDRKTERQVRNISSGNEKPILAELVLDSVQYKILGRIIHHFELEIESKHKNGQKALQSILDYILNRYKSEVKSWTHSKLAIGKALEQLLTKQTWNKYIDAECNILRPTYDKISEMLVLNKM